MKKTVKRVALMIFTVGYIYSMVGFYVGFYFHDIPSMIYNGLIGVLNLAGVIALAMNGWRNRRNKKGANGNERL